MMLAWVLGFVALGQQVWFLKVLLQMRGMVSAKTRRRKKRRTE
jgi:hypothetical protein